MNEMPFVSLGVYLGHDPSACLLIRGELIACIEEERLTRYKHGRPMAIGRLWPRLAGRFGYFPWASVSYCLGVAGLGLDDVDVVAVSGEWCGDGICAMVPLRDPSRLFAAVEPAGGVHHLRHALSAFFASPFESAAVLVVDDDGSVMGGAYESESGYHFTNRCGAWREVFKNRYPADAPVRKGIGWMYHEITSLLGFTTPEVEVAEAGKTMGLASYGGPVKDLSSPWIANNGFSLDFNGYISWRESDEASRLLTCTDSAVPILSLNVAYKAQAELEEAMLALARKLHEATGEPRLCLAGGVALNAVANGRIAREGPFTEIFAVPAAGDSGQSIGLAIQGHLTRGSGLIHPIKHAFGGRSYEHDCIVALLEAAGVPWEDLGDDEALAQRAASSLACEAITVWFKQGSEIGPRALGHRSILADPRPTWMRDHLNARVKFREWFRPFAPSVLHERAKDVFEIESESPYMLRVASVREQWRSRVPAITHIDGTARLQTVDAGVDPLFHHLISLFADQTGVPLVLNTSFNLQGMPIVETPWDALVCSLFTELNVLYLGRCEVPEVPAAAQVPCWNPAWNVTSSSSHLHLAPVRRDVQAVKVSLPDELLSAMRSIDGQRSLEQIATETRIEPRVILRTVQRLLRLGAMYLCVGRLVLPRYMPGLTPVNLPESEHRILVEQAGMLSARSVDK